MSAEQIAQQKADARARALPHHERALSGLKFRAPAEGEQFPEGVIGRVQAILLRYDVLDDRGTIFQKGCLDKTRAQKVPAGRVGLFANMGHDGMGMHYHGTRTHIGVIRSLEDVGNDVLMSADIFDTADGRSVKEYLEAVIASGAHTGASVGFLEREGERIELPGPDGQKIRAYSFKEIELFEGTIVPLSAVPGTEVLAVRALPEAAESALRTILKVVPAARVREIVQEEEAAAASPEARSVTAPAAPAPAGPAPDLATMEERRAALARVLT